MKVLSTQNIKKQAGFTLIELVVVMVILGVMAVGITGFMSLSSQVFVNVSERDEILSNARFVIERMNREVRNAVPNSARLLTTSGYQCLEFIPIKASTFYTKINVAPEDTSNSLTVIDFEDRQGNPYSCPAGCGDRVAVYPLEPSNLYIETPSSGAQTYVLTRYTPPMLPSNSEGTVTLNVSAVFAEHSPTSRAYFFGSPVSYCVFSNGDIERYADYSMSATQAIPSGGNSSLMAEEVLYSMAFPPFEIVGATLERNALVQSTLIFERDGEEISFNNEIQILNTP